MDRRNKRKWEIKRRCPILMGMRIPWSPCVPFVWLNSIWRGAIIHHPFLLNYYNRINYPTHHIANRHKTPKSVFHLLIGTHIGSVRPRTRKINSQSRVARPPSPSACNLRTINDSNYTMQMGSGMPPSVEQMQKKVAHTRNTSPANSVIAFGCGYLCFCLAKWMLKIAID